MKNYDIVQIPHPPNGENWLVLGSKTYGAYDSGQFVNVLTRALNDGWGIEHFAATDSYGIIRYCFVLSRAAESEEPSL